jgi:large conductance mechanosensitive channel
MLREFKEFAMRGNVMDMAIGIIIGAAFGKIVTSLVNDIIMPPIGLALGGVDFADLRTEIGTSTAGEPVYVNWGQFINAVITFVIVAVVVYLIARLFIKEPEPEPTKACPFCLEANHVDASKCRACASAI